MNAIKLTIGLVTLIAVNGFDLRYLDKSVNPCDDFYQFVCGNFPKVEPKPENESLLDNFIKTENAMVQIGKEILSTPKRKTDPVALKKAKAAYKSCVDRTQLNGLWYYEKPERKIIEKFGMPLVDNNQLTKINWTQIGEISSWFGIQQMFEFVVKNFTPEDYILIMIPDSFDEPKMIRSEHIKTYDEVLKESFRNMAKANTRRVLGIDPLDNFILTITKYIAMNKNEVEILNELQQIKTFAMELFSNDEIVDNNMVKLDDVVTLGQLQNWTETQFGDSVNINWVEYFQAQFRYSGLNITENFVVYLYDPKSVYKILNLVRQTDPNIVKNFILLRTFLYMAPDSDEVMREAFETYYKALGLKYYDRPEYCTRKILDVIDSLSLSYAVAHDYLNYHFNNNKIRNAVSIIQNVKKAFRKTLQTSDWLDSKFHDALLEKLDQIEFFLGYPDFIQDRTSLDTFYENVRICQSDNYGNSQRLRAFKLAYSYSKLNNHDMWDYSPFKVNAYTQRQSNRVVVPLSMLHSTFLHGDEIIYDYSRFGSIVGHELLHNFDASGIKTNVNGSLSNSTLEKFNNKKQCLIDQFNGYYVSQIDNYINGTTTLNENMADNGGLKLAYYAWKHLVKEHDFGEFTADQLFFMSFADTWCSQESDAYLTNLVEKNEHSPSRYRVLGILSDLKEFSESFKCPGGSPMNPENKCIVW